MKRVVACGLLLVLPCWGQQVGPLRLKHTPALRKGVAAMPLIANPKSEAERKINTDLREIDRDLRSSLKECDEGLIDSAEVRWKGREAVKQRSKELSTDWARTIDITMVGPRYISLFVVDEYFCGGVHPDRDEKTLIYDVHTGEEVELVVKLPKDSPLAEIYLKHLRSAECRRDLQDDEMWFEKTFLIWPDARSKRIMMAAENTDFAHSMGACAEHIAVTVEEARRFGVSNEAIGAVFPARF